MANNEEPAPYPPPAGTGGDLPYPTVDNDPPGGVLPCPVTTGNDPPAGGLPYPTTDTPGALPYPSANASVAAAPLPYPSSSDALLGPAHPPTSKAPTDSSSTLPYTPTDTNNAYPPGPPGSSSSGMESKTYTDAPPPYSPPVGGTAYPTPPGAPGQLPPPQPGFAPYPTQPMQPYHQAPPGTVTVTRTVQSTGPQVIVTGTCPTCRTGMLQENFTLLGICCAFWFFPLGIICCMAMREKRCTNCGSVFA